MADSSQKPAPGAQVELLPDPPCQSQLALFGQCRTDATGKCSILGIAPGEYHALAFAGESDMDFRDPAGWKDLEPYAKAIRIGEGDRQNAEMKAIPEAP